MTELNLKSIPLFSSLPNHEMEFLTKSMEHQRLDPGEILFSEGEPGDKFYILLDGNVEIIKAMGSVEEQILGTRGPGDFFGEMSLLNPDGIRTASIRTLTPVLLMEISRDDFDALMERRPGLASKIMRVLSLRLRESDDIMIRDLREKNQKLTQAYQELQIAQAQIVEKEKIEHELSLAREIQESILPGNLSLMENFHFGARMEPARSVGGDLYDFIKLDEDTTGIAIGDVSGKGVPAAIFMALFCSLLRAELGHSESPAQVLKRVNNHLLNLNEAKMFVTAVFGILNQKRREFVYARAGHEVPLLYNQAGEIERLAWGQGQLLGYFNNPKLDERKLILPPGSTLLMYSDGALDARDTEGFNFGLNRLQKVTGANIHSSAQLLCDLVMADIKNYQGSRSQFDDITLVVIQSC